MPRLYLSEPLFHFSLQIINTLLICLQAILFLILNGGMASLGLVEIFKDPATLASSSVNDDYFPASYSPQQFITFSCIALAITVLPLSSLAWLILRRARTIFTFQSLYWATVVAVPLAYFLLVIHWFTMDLVSSMVLEIPHSFKEFSRLLCPQLVYLVSLMLMTFTIIVMTLNARGNVSTSYRDHLVEGIVSMLSGLSGTIILLLGRKGPTIVLLAVLEGIVTSSCPDLTVSYIIFLIFCSPLNLAF